MVTFAYGQLLYTYASLRASRVIHAKLVHSLLGSTFRYASYISFSRYSAHEELYLDGSMSLLSLA